MKIFYDYRIFYLQKYGGVSKYFANLNKELNDLNIDSRIYAPININSYLKNDVMQFSEHRWISNIVISFENIHLIANLCARKRWAIEDSNNTEKKQTSKKIDVKTAVFQLFLPDF